MAARDSDTSTISLHARDEERDREWVKATVFVPGRKAHGTDPCQSQKSKRSDSPNVKELCPVCRISLNEIEKKEHIQNCLAAERESRETQRRFMEKCKEMECVVCMENILDTHNPSKIPEKHSFGILDNCNHVFCLPCIRTWRSNTSISNYRSCPYCRTPSDFVAPAVHWVEGDSKEELIQKHKEDLRKFKTMCVALDYVFDGEDDDERGRGVVGEHGFVSYNMMYGATPDILHLATLKEEHWICVTEEMDKIEIDRNHLVTGVPIINELVEFKKLYEDCIEVARAARVMRQALSLAGIPT